MSESDAAHATRCPAVITHRHVIRQSTPQRKPLGRRILCAILNFIYIYVMSSRSSSESIITRRVPPSPPRREVVCPEPK